MTDVALKGVHKVRAKGRTYYYAWRGGPRLPGEPGSREFLEALVAASAKSDESSRINGLVTAYKGSPAYSGLAVSTRKNWAPWLDRIRDDLGKLSIKTFDRPEVRKVIKRWRGKWAHAPRAADNGKQVLSAMLSYAVEEGLLGSNPCFGISNLYSADRSEIIWTEEDLSRFAATSPVEVMLALRLAALTGMRQGDLLKLQWGHVGDLAIEIKTGKSGGKRGVVVPLYSELRALLATIPKRSVFVLTTTKGRPWAGGFGSSWNKARIAAGEKTLHFHDARGTAATKFYLAGFSAEEVAEILGWEKDKVERIINRYVRRDALLRAKIARLDAGSA